MKEHMLKDTQCYAPDGAFPASASSDSIKEVSSLASQSIRSPSHAVKRNITEKGAELCANDSQLAENITAVDKSSFRILDITNTSNNLDFCENAEDKDSSDFLNNVWSEIADFEDVDEIFRNSDATFGVGATKEDGMGWFLSADSVERCGEVPGFNFLCAGADLVKKITENHDSSKTYCVNDPATKMAPISCKDTSWTAGESDSSNNPAMADTQDGYACKKQVKETKKQIKLQDQPVEKKKEHYFGNGSFCYMNNKSNEVKKPPSETDSDQVLEQKQACSPDSYNFLQNPLSYAHSDNSHVSASPLVNPPLPSIKCETNVLTSHSLSASYHASIQLQHLECLLDPPLQVSVAGVRKGEKLHNCQGSQSYLCRSLKNASAMVQASVGDIGSIGNQVHCFGDKVERHRDVVGGSLVTLTESGSSNIKERSTMSSSWDNVSPEVVSLCQLRLVTEQLDLKTKLCIRDSLYRLAWSAEQRHNETSSHGGFEDERDSSGAFVTNRMNNFADMERDTNPIDRSIAHLLFHRPPESSAIPSVVHGSATSLPIRVEDFVVGEETTCEIEKPSAS